MEEYIVSARKYRPATFDTVVGQRALTTTLLNAIRTGKLAHAYLFCGPRGVGKTTCARIFAKTINCLDPQDNGEACNVCESCRAFEEQRSLNIHELDAASNNSVEDIRELIEQTRIPPQVGRYKVFIIDEVHMLSNQAFNAFLKTLEEPPHYCIFILATTEKHKILPTILSRCQVYDFARMTIQNTVDHLAYVAEKEGYQADPEALNLIAQKADGGMRDALSIFDQLASFTGGHITLERTLENLNMLNTDYYFRLVDHFVAHEVEPCMLLLNEVLQKGYDAGNFIAGLATHMRNLLVARDESTLPLLEVSASQIARFREQAQKCSPRFLYRAIKLCNNCDLGYRQSHNKRLQVEICLIQCAQVEDDDSAGHCPAKILKPIFQQLAARVAAQPAPAAAPQRMAAQPPVNTPSPAAPASTARSASERKIQTMTWEQLGLKNPYAKETESKPQEKHKEELQVQVQNLVHRDGKLTEDNLRICWNTYATNLPRQQAAMAQRMRGITPVLLDDNTFEITVFNHETAQSIASMKPSMQKYICQAVGIDQVTINIRESIVEAQRYLSKPELLKSMIAKNPCIQQLMETLHLQLDQ